MHAAFTEEEARAAAEAAARREGFRARVVALALRAHPTERGCEEWHVVLLHECDHFRLRAFSVRRLVMGDKPCLLPKYRRLSAHDIRVMCGKSFPDFQDPRVNGEEDGGAGEAVRRVRGGGA